jgi:nucleoside-diphosphate-sugar epimerase
MGRGGGLRRCQSDCDDAPARRGARGRRAQLRVHIDAVGIRSCCGPDRPDRVVCANAYARTKLAAERAVLEADSPAMHTVVLRPRAIIGPYDQVLLPRLLRAADKGVMPLPRAGRALIEPTDARDVVAALLAAEARAEAIGGRVFNISGGQPVTLAALVSHIFGRLGRGVRVVPVPAPAVLAAGAVLETIARLRPASSEPVLTRYGAMTLGWSQTFDLSAAREALGWEPRRHPFEAVDWALKEMSFA